MSSGTEQSLIPTLPREAIPDEVYDAFNNKDANSQLMLVTTVIQWVRMRQWKPSTRLDKMVKNHCFVAGMAAVNADTKTLVMQQAPIYVIIAALLSMHCHGNYNGFNNCSDVIPPKHRNGYYL